MKRCRPLAAQMEATVARLKPVVRVKKSKNDQSPRQLPAWVTSVTVHLPYIIVFLIYAWNAPIGEPVPHDGAVVEVKAEESHNFTNEDVGLDPTKQLNFNIDRIED